MRAVLIILVSGMLTSFAKAAIITGKIKNTNEELLYYTSPIDKFSGAVLNNSIRLNYVNSIAQFSLSIYLSSPTFIKLQINSVSILLLLEPNDSLFIDLDCEKYTRDFTEFKVHGNNAEGHLLYNKNNINPIENYIEIFDVFDKPYISINHFINEIDRICKSKMDPYYKLYYGNLISERYLKRAARCSCRTHWRQKAPRRAVV